MQPRRFADRRQLATAAAEHVARAARDAIEARGRFTLALSGGTTPWAMLDVLAGASVDWCAVQVFQVDERRAPDGDPARNWTRITAHLLDPAGVPAANHHPMPVGREPANAGAAAYAATLRAHCGDPPRLDLVQLGLGADGHTASLVPGDSALGITDADVAWSGEYQGHRRMTLTFPVLDRARQRLWLVAGADKACAIAGLLAGDDRLPAARVTQRDSVLMLAD